jgi:hypothetical protein
MKLKWIENVIVCPVTVLILDVLSRIRQFKKAEYNGDYSSSWFTIGSRPATPFRKNKKGIIELSYLSPNSNITT